MAAFPAEAQADGLAQSRAGALFAAVTIRAHTKDDEATRGQIYRVTRAGTKSRFGPRLPTGCGILTAVAFDRAGHLYVADATSSKRPAPGVFRVNATGATRVLTLPMNSFPTGLVFHAGSLYVSDSDRGAIYRWNRSAQPAPAVLRAPWLADNRLASAHAVDRGGPSGLALHDGRLYIAVPAAGTTHGGAPIGRLFAVPLKPSGSHGPLRLVTTSPKLAAVSGISVAQSGVLWMVSHGRHAKAGTPNGSQQLIRLAPGHKLRVVADEASWMNDPTAVVIDHACRTLHLLNGALIHGTSNIVQLRWRDAAAGQTTRPRRGGLSAQTGMRR